MNSDHVHIEDILSLESLKVEILDTGARLEDITAGIDAYFESVLDGFQKTIEFFKKGVDEAQKEIDIVEKEVYYAESDYENCKRSQEEVEDEDGNKYLSPSCSIESGRLHKCQADLDRAKKVRDIWQHRYDEAQRIYDETNGKIRDFYHSGGFASPSGGGVLLKGLHERHTKESVDKMDSILDVVNDIMSVSFSLRLSSVPPKNERFRDGMEKIRERTENERSQRKDKFKKAKEKIDEELDERYKDAPTPTIFRVCPGCERPIVFCKCKKHERER